MNVTENIPILVFQGMAKTNDLSGKNLSQSPINKRFLISWRFLISCHHLQKRRVVEPHFLEINPDGFLLSMTWKLKHKGVWPEQRGGKCLTLELGKRLWKSRENMTRSSLSKIRSRRRRLLHQVYIDPWNPASSNPFWPMKSWNSWTPIRSTKVPPCFSLISAIMLKSPVTNQGVELWVASCWMSVRWPHRFLLIRSNNWHKWMKPCKFDEHLSSLDGNSLFRDKQIFDHPIRFS